MMKALLWALYLPVYPDMFIEGSFKGRYKPDVVALDSQGNPRFWGEAGRLGLNKIRFLARKYRTTHFAISKWDQPLKPYLKIIEDAAAGLKRTRPVDLIRFSSDSPERFIDREGQIHISQSDIEWIRIL